MAAPDPRRTVTVEIDARLAAEYKTAYALAFGAEAVRNQSLSTFIAGFVEDRLAEEIAFARTEAVRESK